MKTNEKKVIISVGAGGVGKTTISCVLGCYYASLGNRVLVITIDPARRLLDALGVKSEEHKKHTVDLDKIIKEQSKGGSLEALMPDLKTEWLDFIESSVNKKISQEIIKNPFYQYLIDGLPGALEIICCHVLYREIKSASYDVIILDTPPASQSIAFFDVPQKIRAVLEKNILRILIKKRNSKFFKLTKKFAQFSSNVLEKTLEKVIGSQILSELLDFAVTIDSLYDPLLKRVKTVDKLLKDDLCEYVLITNATHRSIEDASKLVKELDKRKIKINKVVINKLLQEIDSNKLNNEINRISNERDRKIVGKISQMYATIINRQKEIISALEETFFEKDIIKLYIRPHLQLRSALLASLVKDMK